jgi:hypothetical protein
MEEKKVDEEEHHEDDGSEKHQKEKIDGEDRQDESKEVKTED